MGKFNLRIKEAKKVNSPAIPRNTKWMQDLRTSDPQKYEMIKEQDRERKKKSNYALKNDNSRAAKLQVKMRKEAIRLADERYWQRKHKENESSNKTTENLPNKNITPSELPAAKSSSSAEKSPIDTNTNRVEYMQNYQRQRRAAMTR